MKKFFEWLESSLIPWLGRLANQTHLKAVRDGLIAIMPLTIVGSLPLLLAFPFAPKPQVVDGIFNGFIAGWYNWLAQPGVKDTILMPQKLTFGLMALFAAMTIAYSLARHYKMNELSAVIVSGATFFLVASPAEVVLLGKAKISAMPVDLLGGKGLFTSILVGLFTVEISRFLKKRNFTIRLPEGVPPAVAGAFDNMVPLFANILVFYGISIALQAHTGLLLPAWVMKVLAPAVAAVDSPGMVFFSAFMANLFWFSGIHGATIVSTALLGAFFEQNLAANAAALIEGQPLPYIFTKMFWAYYMVFGGSGATLALVFFYLRSKSAHLNSIGKVALLPAIFNINEPIIFGTPIVFNPLLFFPFVLIQGVVGVIAYYATKFGWVGAAVLEAPWTAPAPFGAFYTTQDVRAVVLVFGLIILSALLWYPFFKAYERQVLTSDAEESEE
jgi:PTS system cellobiose-specific IIC component